MTSNTICHISWKPRILTLWPGAKYFILFVLSCLLSAIAWNNVGSLLLCIQYRNEEVYTRPLEFKMFIRPMEDLVTGLGCVVLWWLSFAWAYVAIFLFIDCGLFLPGFSYLLTIVISFLEFSYASRQNPRSPSPYTLLDVDAVDRLRAHPAASTTMSISEQGLDREGTPRFNHPEASGPSHHSHSATPRRRPDASSSNTMNLQAALDTSWSTHGAQYLRTSEEGGSKSWVLGGEEAVRSPGTLPPRVLSRSKISSSRWSLTRGVSPSRRSPYDGAQDYKTRLLIEMLTWQPHEDIQTLKDLIHYHTNTTSMIDETHIKTERQIYEDCARKYVVCVPQPFRVLGREEYFELDRLKCWVKLRMNVLLRTPFPPGYIVTTEPSDPVPESGSLYTQRTVSPQSESRMVDPQLR